MAFKVLVFLAVYCLLVLLSLFGFSFYWSVLRAGEQNESEDIQQIVSPNYPDDYPAKSNCAWHLKTAPGHIIKLERMIVEAATILVDPAIGEVSTATLIAGSTRIVAATFTVFDDFQLDELSGNDYVEIYDGGSIYSPALGPFWGSSLPHPIVSSTNELYMVFRSDDAVNGKGFLASYKTAKDECSVASGRCQPRCWNQKGSYLCSCNEGFTLHENKYDCKRECKYEITDLAGYIDSSNLPSDCTDCTWHFKTTPGHIINLILDEFKMAYTWDYDTNYITLFDGNSTSSRRLGTFWGCRVPVPQAVFSSTNELYMVFKSRKEDKSNRFSVFYGTGYLEKVTRPILKVKRNGTWVDQQFAIFHAVKPYTRGGRKLS